MLLPRSLCRAHPAPLHDGCREGRDRRHLGDDDDLLYLSRQSTGASDPSGGRGGGGDGRRWTRLVAHAATTAPRTTSCTRATASRSAAARRSAPAAAPPRPRQRGGGGAAAGRRRLPADTRYFIMKSYSMADLRASMQKGAWATQARNEQAERGVRGRVVRIALLRSTSRAFRGTRMASKTGGAASDVTWMEGSRGAASSSWSGGRSSTSAAIAHLRNPMNEHKPIKISRDGQEVGQVGRPSARPRLPVRRPGYLDERRHLGRGGGGRRQAAARERRWWRRRRRRRPPRRRRGRRRRRRPWRRRRRRDGPDDDDVRGVRGGDAAAAGARCHRSHPRPPRGCSSSIMSLWLSRPPLPPRRRSSSR